MRWEGSTTLRNIELDELTKELLAGVRDQLKSALGSSISVAAVCRRALRMYAEHVAGIMMLEERERSMAIMRENVQVNMAKEGR